MGEVKEVFYIRQRPTVPQPGDGIIRSPVAGGTRHDWHDAFKIDYNGREMTLKDLPSKDAILFIKKRVSLCWLLTPSCSETLGWVPTSVQVLVHGM